MNSFISMLRTRLAFVALILFTPYVGFAQKNNTISIDFPGGPLSKFVEQLQTNNATTLTIINTDKLDPALPAFAVQNEYPEKIIHALSQILITKGYILVPVGGTLAVLRKDEPPRTQYGFAAFQLGSKLGGKQSIEEITAAIQTACEFAGEEPGALRFKFHPGTKMLFVAGPQVTIDRIVRQVIASLPEAVL